MVLRNHNVYGFGSRVVVWSSAPSQLRAMMLARDVPAEVNGQETRLLDRGHHRCGRLNRARSSA